MKHTFNDAPFVVQPLKDGEYRVHCVTVGPSIEVQARFPTQEKAQKWIGSESKAWLEQLVAQAMNLKATPGIPLSVPYHRDRTCQAQVRLPDRRGNHLARSHGAIDT